MQYTDAETLKKIIKNPRKYDANQAFTEAFKKPHKYHAERVTVDGIGFASRKEADRWIQLRTLEVGHAITNLKRQVRYELTVVTHYVSDFEYDMPDGRHVVEDVKGFRTQRYKQLKRLMKQQHNVDIRET